MTLVTLITPTNIQEPAFKLLEKYMQRQTYQDKIYWIVVDDSPTPITPKSTFADKRITQEIFKSPQLWQQGYNTQRICLDEGIKHIPPETDYILMPEYDDWFRKDYIELMVYFLQKFPLVGQGNSKYYAVKDRSYKNWGNFIHCSLTETGFRKELINLFARSVNSGQVFCDVAFWANAKAEKVSNFVFDHIGLACGMKQLGTTRSGIGAGHDGSTTGFVRDPMFEKLKEWIGVEDAKPYQTWGRGK
jgi:hypothetical protein